MYQLVSKASGLSEVTQADLAQRENRHGICERLADATKGGP
jgi:hypothetical protein